MLLPLFAQNNNTYSPFTRYGYGDLQPQSFGISQSMGGICYGVRDSRIINPANPAAYTSVQSKTFMMDLGVSALVQGLSTENSSITQMAGNLDYVAFQIPFCKWAAASFGLMPYSAVGYQYSVEAENDVYDRPDSTVTVTQSYSGSGGFTQVYLGFSFDILDRVALGVNGRFMFGKALHERTATFSDSYYASTSEVSTLYSNVFLCDVGLQYHQPIGNDMFVLGAAYTIGMPTNFKSVCSTYTNVTHSDTVYSGFDQPHSVGVGVSYKVGSRATVGVDYQWQDFADARFYGVKDSLRTTHKIAVGAEYVHNAGSKRYIDNMRWRIGANFSNSYFRVNDRDFNRFAITWGIGFPLPNTMTLLNLHMEYGHRGSIAVTQIAEDYFKIGIDVSLNETWFVKRKFN